MRTAAVAVVALAALVSCVLCYNSCLQQRSSCIRNPQCREIFESFEGTCGYSLAKCSVASPSDCVFDIQRIRGFFSFETCVCYEALGFTEECDYFRQLIWNHPCERRLADAGVERRMIESNHFLAGSSTISSVRRTTRTPLSDQVRQWKTQLSGELETRQQLEQGTCDVALNRVCLQHVSCRQLWRLFRQSCGVDQDNQCTMADREVCWQSFEGLSWTGLGSCHCDSNNSDCHWIRLHTNYNKCIYEISKSGAVPSLRSDSRHNAQQYQRRYESQQEYGRQNEYAAPVQYTTPSTTTTRAPPPTRPPTTTTTTTTTPRPPPPTRPPHRESPVRATTAPVWWEAPTDRVRQPDERERQWENERRREQDERDRQTEGRDTQRGRIQVILPEAQIHYRPLFLPDSPPPSTSSDGYYGYSTAPPRAPLRATTTTTSTTTTSTTTTPRPFYTTRESPRRDGNRQHNSGRSDDSSRRQQHGQNGQTAQSSQPSVEVARRESATSFVQKEPAKRSSCQSALSRCDLSEDCRWHLGELRVRCTKNDCRRDDCAVALQRFSRYVPFELVEAVMFCRCAAEDAECQREQDLLYPKCLYSSSAPVATCTQNARRCDSDPRCRSLRHSLSSNCPVSDEQCARTSLADCRKTILSARASLLEQPCFCPLSDVECIAHQRIMIPNNPCIEKAMLDYAKSHSNSAEASSIETNRVPDTNTQVPRSTMPSVQDVDQKRSDVEMTSSGRGRPPTTKKPKPKHQTTTSTTTPKPVVDEEVKQKKIGTESKSSKSRHRTTAEPPSTTELPPPWVTTTHEAPTTTTTFITHPPPPPEGCQTRDANGRHIFVNVGSVIRRYVDWSGRCSSWCECVSEDDLTCSRLPCLEDGQCQAPLTTIDFGERLFLRDRGACYCETGKFICDFPEEMPETYPGLYISAGYSLTDVEMLHKEVPHDVLERAGFLSADASTDIGSKLQMAFERILPTQLSCRIVLMAEMSEPGNAFFRVEWFGMNEILNHTKTQWHHGDAEKVCATYVVSLADLFAQSESTRYHLVLSTVKQIKVMDYLDGLPLSSSYRPLVFLTTILVSFRIL